MRRVLSGLCLGLAAAVAAVPPAIAGDRDVCESDAQDEASIAACSRVIKRGPADEEMSDIYYRRGMKYRANRDFDKAIKDFGEAIRLKPAWAWPYVARGHTYAWTKQFDKAIADQEKAIKLDRSHVTYVGRGMDLEAAGRVQEAIDDYTQALQLNPKYIYARLNRASAYMKVERYKEAVSDYRAALDIGSKYENDMNIAREGLKKAQERLGRAPEERASSRGNGAQ